MVLLFVGILLLIILKCFIFEKDRTSEGIDKIHKGDIKGAENDFKQGLLKDPINICCAHNLSLLYMESGRYDEVINILEIFKTKNTKKPIRDSKELYIVYINLAEAYIKKNKHDKAMECYEYIIANDRSDPSSILDNLSSKGNFRLMALELAGDNCSLLKQYEKAVEYYKRAGILTSRYKAGCLELYKIKNYVAAIEEFELAVTIEPNNKEARLGLGYSYLAAGNKIMAEEQYKRLYSLDHKIAKSLFEAINKNESHGINNNDNELAKYYDVLEVPLNATLQQIKEAYYELVKVWHPDRFLHDPKMQSKAVEKMKKINEAYERLCAVAG